MSMIYTKTELIKRIRAIDEQRLALANKPTTASVKGLSSSYTGKAEELARLRTFYVQELEKLEAAQDGINRMQGPKKEVW